MDEVWNKHTDKFLMYGDRVEKAVKRSAGQMNPRIRKPRAPYGARRSTPSTSGPGLRTLMITGDAGWAMLTKSPARFLKKVALSFFFKSTW